MTPIRTISLTDALKLFPMRNGTTFTFWPPKEEPMRKLSAKAKTDNILAAHKAHAVQQADLVSRVQAANADLKRNGERLAVALEDRDSTITTQAAAIALFKQEALQAATTIAELKGYIARTLEDDAVREADSKPAQVFDTHTTHTPTMGAPVQPLRSGPSVLQPMFIVGIDGASGCDMSSFPLSSWESQAATNKPPAPKHWLER